jgi:hypothetical protein
LFKNNCHIEIGPEPKGEESSGFLNGPSSRITIRISWQGSEKKASFSFSALAGYDIRFRCLLPARHPVHYQERVRLLLSFAGAAVFRKNDHRKSSSLKSRILTASSLVASLDVGPI